MGEENVHCVEEQGLSCCIHIKLRQIKRLKYVKTAGKNNICLYRTFMLEIKSKIKEIVKDWAKGIAPSTELRKWLGHKADHFEEFQTKYLAELRTGDLKRSKVAELYQFAKEGRITLLYAAKDHIYNHARVLKEEIISYGASLSTHNI
jgi:uncharacterized protein YeaO (DUF488 family)